MTEYRIDIKVRNNLILKRIEIAGYESIPKFCHAVGIVYHTLLNFINMKSPIFSKSGKIRKEVLTICEKLDCLPEDLFTESQMHSQLKTNKKAIEVNEHEAKLFIERYEPKVLEEEYTKEKILENLEKALDTLTPKEKEIIELRFYENKTLEEIGKMFNVTRTRIREIEGRALRKLRHPSRSYPIQQLLEDET